MKMLRLYRDIQTYKENREFYSREERKVIKNDFRKRLKDNNEPLEI